MPSQTSAYQNIWIIRIDDTSHPNSRNLLPIFCPRSRLIDGTEVFQEVYCKSNKAIIQEDVPKRGPDKPPTGHHDCITDLAIVTSPQHFLISAARDGAIKVWK